MNVMSVATGAKDVHLHVDSERVPPSLVDRFTGSTYAQVGESGKEGKESPDAWVPDKIAPDNTSIRHVLENLLTDNMREGYSVCGARKHRSHWRMPGPRAPKSTKRQRSHLRRPKSRERLKRGVKQARTKALDLGVWDEQLLPKDREAWDQGLGRGHGKQSREGETREVFALTGDRSLDVLPTKWSDANTPIYQHGIIQLFLPRDCSASSLSGCGGAQRGL